MPAREPSSPAWCPELAWEGMGRAAGEERVPSGLRPCLHSAHGSVVGPLPRPHAPRSWANVFLPGSPWYLSGLSCFAALGLHCRDPGQVLAQGKGESPCGLSRGAQGSRQEGRAGSRGIPGWRPQWEWVRWLPQGGGSGGVGWGGGCLRQEGQMGQGRVEVKGGGREPILGGSQGGRGAMSR